MEKFSKAQIILMAGGSILIIAATIYLSIGLNSRPKYEFVQVKKTDLTGGLTANGTVQAAQDLDLAFQAPGTISQIPATVGQQVKQGQVLAQLDAGSAHAALDQAAAAVQTAQANYQKLINGATSANVDVSQATVASAQTNLDDANKALTETTSQQNLLVANALSALLNTVNPVVMTSGLTAVPSASNSGNAVVTVTGTYNGTAQGQYILTVVATGSGLVFQVTGLENTTALVRTAPVPLGTNGLSVQASGNAVAGDSWTISIPNTQSSAYVSDYNAYQAAMAGHDAAILAAQNQVAAAQAALVQAQAGLQLVQTPPRPEDVDAAKAAVATAEAALEAAQSAYSNTVIVAPIAGTVTAINAKVGQSASPGAPEISMISQGNFQVDFYVSEDDVGKIKTGDAAQVTLDAYGSGVIFPATVAVIDQSTTMVNNVPSYKVTLEFNNNDDRIKSGMNASVTVTDQTESQVLAVPSNAIFTENNTSFVLKQAGGGKTVAQPVKTGISSLDGMTEITSGLNEGDEVIYFGNN